MTWIEPLGKALHEVTILPLLHLYTALHNNMIHAHNYGTSVLLTCLKDGPNYTWVERGKMLQLALYY